MADEGNADTFEYPINGRTLVLRKIDPGRVKMLERFWNAMEAKAEASSDPDEIVRIAKEMSDAVWGMVESQFIDPQDLEFVQKEIIAGRLTEATLGPIMANGQTRVSPPDDDADPAPAKRPGRKAPAKKAAKKAAPSTRAKR